jgi:hypothetical protein
MASLLDAMLKNSKVHSMPSFQTTIPVTEKPKNDVKTIFLKKKSLTNHFLYQNFFNIFLF